MADNDAVKQVAMLIEWFPGSITLLLQIFVGVGGFPRRKGICIT